MQKNYSQNLSGCICENIKYLKSIAHTSLIVFDEIISVITQVNKKGIDVLTIQNGK